MLRYIDPGRKIGTDLFTPRRVRAAHATSAMPAGELPLTFIPFGSPSSAAQNGQARRGRAMDGASFAVRTGTSCRRNPVLSEQRREPEGRDIGAAFLLVTFLWPCKEK